MADSPPAAFDPYAPEVLERSPDAFAELGQRCPVHHYQGKFDFFIASDYREIKENVLRDHATWTARNGNTPRVMDERYASGISTDPPEHFAIRSVIMRGFGPEQMKRLGGEIDRIANELIDAMQADPAGEGNFFERFAMPLAARLMCLMLGAPESEYLTYKQWADDMTFVEYNVPEETIDAHARKVNAHFGAMLAERIAKLEAAGVKPSLEHVGTVLPDDFMSRYLCDKVGDRPLKKYEVLNMVAAIFIGGNETTMNLICNLLWRLLELPARWERLKAEPALIPAAIEESLRFDPPVIGLFRTSTCPVKLGEVEVPARSKVLYNIAAANRDPERWPNPDEFSLDRPLAELRQHLSFSAGAHACLGLGLARMELKQVFELLTTRLPKLRLTGASHRAPGFNFWGREDLPVAWK